MDAPVEARFGRAPYFIIIDTETMAHEAIENPNISAGGGAGIQSAQLIAEHDVKFVLTGNCGPNAFNVFGAAGVQIIVGVTGTVIQAVEQFKTNAFDATNQPNVESHFGVGGGQGMSQGMGIGRGMGQGMGQGMGGGRGMGQGMGQGMGGGRGMGQGMGQGMGGGRGMGQGMGQGMGGGRGMGQGMGSGRGMAPAGGIGYQTQPGEVSKEEELAALKEQTRILQEQLKNVQAQIDESEKKK